MWIRVRLTDDDDDEHVKECGPIYQNFPILHRPLLHMGKDQFIWANTYLEIHGEKLAPLGRVSTSVTDGRLFK